MSFSDCTCDLLKYFTLFSAYSWIFVRFSSDFFQPFVKVPSLTLSDLISQLGAISCLLAGVSILSIIEVFHFMIVELTRNTRKVQPLNQPIDSTPSWVNSNHVLFHLSKYFLEFIKFSNIHGIRHTQSSNICVKIFWIILEALSILFCLFLVTNAYNNIEKSPKETRIESEKWTIDDVRFFLELAMTAAWIYIILQISFPAILICPDADVNVYENDKRCFTHGICHNTTLSEV